MKKGADGSRRNLAVKSKRSEGPRKRFQDEVKAGENLWRKRPVFPLGGGGHEGTGRPSEPPPPPFPGPWRADCCTRAISDPPQAYGLSPAPPTLHALTLMLSLPPVPPPFCAAGEWPQGSARGRAATRTAPTPTTPRASGNSSRTASPAPSARGPPAPARRGPARRTTSAWAAGGSRGRHRSSPSRSASLSSRRWQYPTRFARSMRSGVSGYVLLPPCLLP